jgi:hypothetical protein
VGTESCFGVWRLRCTYVKDVDVQYDLVLYGFREWWIVITDNFRYNMADKHKKMNLILLLLRFINSW